MKRNKSLFLVFVVSVMVAQAVSCKSPTPTKSPLPIPESPLSVSESPLPTPGGEDVLAPQIERVPFRIDKPLWEGDTRVTGTGPAGVPIRLADVTFVGEFIAAGQIEEDGTFEIILSKPLETSHRVGLTIDLAGTPWTVEDFQAPEFNGDEALMVPQVGFYYDTAMVQEP